MPLINNLLSNTQSPSLLERLSQATASSSKRLGSGKRQVNASDDVAKSAVGAQIAGQLFGLRASLNNVNQGASLLQVASGGVSQISDILNRQKSLATQANSGAVSNADRSRLNQEFQALTQQINQISGGTSFNGVSLLSGSQNANAVLVQSNAAAAAFSPGTANANVSTDVASSTAIQAFNASSGASLAGAAAPGQLQLVDAGGAPLANAAFNTVNSAVSGKFSDFSLTNVNIGVSATLTATINGVEFSGTVANGATTATLTNGNTSIQLGLTAVSLANAGAVATSEATISNDFANTSILRTTNISGVDFSGTRLAGAVGAPATGNASVRLDDTSSVSISNFRFVSSGGANNNTLAVDINGKTFNASGVRDTVDDTTAARYTFSDGTGQALTLDVTGLAAGAGAIGNIRTNANDQKQFIDALNNGFAKAGGGLNFDAGDGQSLSVALGSASSASLFNGQSLDISSASGAATAASALDAAISKAASIGASIGASQSRFNFAADSLSSSIAAQEAARSSLQDTDVAEESTNFASLKVQQQAAIAVAAQTKKLSSGLLKLIQ